jgi:hypothetical protein
MAISNYVLGSSPANIYTSSGDTVVSVMYFVNNDSTARRISLWALPSGATVANVNYQVYNGVQIASGDTYVVDMEKLVFANGDRLAANCDTGSVVTATISYVGI